MTLLTVVESYQRVGESRIFYLQGRQCKQQISQKFWCLFTRKKKASHYRKP